MNGTKDPLNPFDGGDVSLFGLFISRGKVRSSRGSAQYFADLNNITGTPEASETEVADGVRVERVLWRNDSHVEVELVATRRRTRHASALLALSALIGSYAQGAERTGGDMGLLRATAVELATVAKVESNGVAFGGRSIPCSPLIRVPKWTKMKTWNQPSPDFGPTRQVSADMKSQLNRPAPS